MSKVDRDLAESGLGVRQDLAQDQVVHLDEVEQAGAPGGGAPSELVSRRHRRFAAVRKVAKEAGAVVPCQVLEVAPGCRGRS